MEGIKKILGFRGDNEGSPLGFSDRKSIETDSKPLANTRTDADLSADTRTDIESSVDTRTDIEPYAETTTFAETRAFARKMNKQLDVWLEENVPMHMHENSTISPTKKLVKCLVCIGCIACVAGIYKKDMAAIPTRKQRRRYKRMSAGVVIGFSVLLYCTYFQTGIFKPVRVEREPGDTDAHVLFKGVKKRLTPKEGSLLDRYIVRNMPSLAPLGKLLQKHEPDQDSKTSSK